MKRIESLLKAADMKFGNPFLQTFLVIKTVKCKRGISFISAQGNILYANIWVRLATMTGKTLLPGPLKFGIKYLSHNKKMFV